MTSFNFFHLNLYISRFNSKSKENSFINAQRKAVTNQSELLKSNDLKLLFQSNSIMMLKEKRVSNKLKQKQLETKYLEEQTKKMEDKLGELKRQIQQQKKLRSQLGLDSTVTRWQKTAITNAPLKSYAKQVLQEQKRAHAQFGISQKKITGSKAFEGVLKKLKEQKDEQQERNPTKITTFLQQPEANEQIEHKTVLENNFFKAKMDVKSLIKQKSLEEFLEQNFILEYLKRFQDEGINDLQSLRYITREKLQELDVKAGHQIKIIKKIKEQFEKMINGKQEEPPASAPQATSLKVESGYGQGDVNTYQEELPLELNSKITEQNNYPNEQEGDYGEQQQDQVLITVPTIEISLQAEQQAKFNCYQCYKTISLPDLHHDEKYFCSQFCINKYLSLLRKSCPNCGKGFLKTQGYREQGIWFCSLGCCPNHQQIQQLFFLWHQRSE